MTTGSGREEAGPGRSPVWPWLMYDWANSAFATTIMAGFYPVFFKKYWASGMEGASSTALLGTGASASVVFVLLSVVGLGVLADRAGARRIALGFFCVLGAVATCLLAVVPRGGTTAALVLYIAGMVGFAAGNAFYDALLPVVATPDRYDSVSSRGFALGYAGGGILLAVQVAMVTFPRFFGLADEVAAVKASFVTTGLWWIAFALPLLATAKEPRPRGEVAVAREIAAGFRKLVVTLMHMRSHKDLLLFLLAFWCYSDGVGTIIKMATAFGADIGLGTSSMMGALLLVQFVGIPAALAFGWLAGRLGRRTMIFAAIAAYSGIVALAAFMSTALHFWLLALAVAMFQGGIQAISRSLFASMTPEGRSAEFFGLYNVASKLSTLIGPLLVGWVGALTGNPRVGIFALLALFAAGAALLSRVDPRRGREAAASGD